MTDLVSKYIPGMVYISEMEDLTPEQRQEIIGIAGYDYRTTARGYEKLLADARETAEFEAMNDAALQNKGVSVFDHYGPVFPVPVRRD